MTNEEPKGALTSNEHLALLKRFGYERKPYTIPDWGTDKKTTLHYWKHPDGTRHIMQPWIASSLDVQTEVIWPHIPGLRRVELDCGWKTLKEHPQWLYHVKVITDLGDTEAYATEEGGYRAAAARAILGFMEDFDEREKKKKERSSDN